MTTLIGDQAADEFWLQVKTNLLAGRIRMLFVADIIPVELRRIVEFLNQQMDPAEVLAVELRQFAGEGLKTLVPMVFGQTQKALEKRGGSPPGQRWDEQRLFEKLKGTVGRAEIEIARKIFDWMKKGDRPLVYGTGRENGSVYPVFRPDGVQINPVYLSTDGKLWFQFGSLDNKPVFGSLEARRELMQRFAEIDGVNLSEADLHRYPSLPLSKIAADQNGLTKVLGALSWMEEQISRASST